MRSQAQHERQRSIEERQAREKELSMLEVSRQHADPRYVRDVVAWLWHRIVERKRAELGSYMPMQQERRLKRLLRLERMKAA